MFTSRYPDRRPGRLIRDPLRLVGGVVALALAATACGGGSGTVTQIPSVRGPFALPTSGWRPGDPALTAEVIGVLNGSSAVDGGCVWLGPPNGPRQPIIWPAGFTARLEPTVEVYDQDGKVVARGGETIDVGGGLVPAKGLRCMFGHDEAFSVMSAVNVVPGSPNPTPSSSG